MNSCELHFINMDLIGNQSSFFYFQNWYVNESVYLLFRNLFYFISFLYKHMLKLSVFDLITILFLFVSKNNNNCKSKHVKVGD